MSANNTTVKQAQDWYDYVTSGNYVTTTAATTTATNTYTITTTTSTDIANSIYYYIINSGEVTLNSPSTYTVTLPTSNVVKVASTKVVKQSEEFDGLPAAECLRRYKLALKSIDGSNDENAFVTYCKIMKDKEDGRKYVDFCEDGFKTEAERLIAKAYSSAYCLTKLQFETAQKEWSKEVKKLSDNAAKKDKLQIVVDNSIPGDYD